MGQKLERPRLDIGRGESIESGESAWWTFCQTAAGDQIARAVAVLARRRDTDSPVAKVPRTAFTWSRVRIGA